MATDFFTNDENQVCKTCTQAQTFHEFTAEYVELLCILVRQESLVWSMLYVPHLLTHYMRFKSYYEGAADIVHLIKRQAISPTEYMLKTETSLVAQVRVVEEL